MNSVEYNQLLEKSLCGRLTSAEQARLEAYCLLHPEAQADWEEELALNSLLEQVPNAPLASNFTAQVLQAVALEEKRATRSRRSPWSWVFRWSWVKTATFAAVFVGVGLLSYDHFQELHREQVAHNLLKLTQATTIPSVEVLRDFDAISRLSQVPPAVDMDLLAVSQ